VCVRVEPQCLSEPPSSYWFITKSLSRNPAVDGVSYASVRVAAKSCSSASKGAASQRSKVYRQAHTQKLLSPGSST